MVSEPTRSAAWSKPTMLPLDLCIGVAIFGHQRAIAEECFKWRCVLQHSAHDQHRVEPVFELAWERLGDEICWEPLFPVVRVGAIAQC